VITIREPDMGTHRVIVDDTAAMLDGAPQEVPSTVAGWGEVALPIASDAVLPFEAGVTRALLAQSDPTGGLIYAPTIPASSHYNVYVSFAQGPDRVSDAHYIVRHSGGETHFRVDQRRHGSTWVLLGEFYFEEGADAEGAAVVVLDDSDEPGKFVSSDAVRFGGGMAMYERDGGTSERPFCEHGARLYTHWNGAPPDVFDWNSTEYLDDYTARSRFVPWEHEDGEDAVYVAWHTDASNATGRGTVSFAYGNDWDAPFSGVAGSLELRDAVHAQIVDDLRAAWDPEWVDRGRRTADFAETNPNHNGEVPAVLFEIAFHDTPAEAAQLRDPRFRRIAARAMAQGIAEYFADQDGVPLVLPPEPPTAVWIRNDGAGGLVVEWTPPASEPGEGDPAEGWVVEVSTNGYGFDDGTLVRGTTHAIDGLAAGDVVHVRVRGSNPGGVSLPSQTVAAAVAPSGIASVLVVVGFDRIDGAMLVPDDASSYGQGVVDRMWLRRINDGSYAVRHAAAIAASGFSLDGATDDAVEQGHVELAGYQAVDWFVGEDSTGNAPITETTRGALESYLDAGGRLLLSGAELGWALDEHGTPEQRTFFRERMHARYSTDDAETYDVTALAGPLEEVAPLSFADPSSYDPRFPDVLTAEPDGALVLAYQNADGGGAAIAWGTDGTIDRGVVLGFPFETIAGEAARNDLMARVLAFFGTEELPGMEGESTGAGDDGGSTSGGEPVTSGDSGPDADSSGGTGSTGAQDGRDPSGCGCRSSGANGSAWSAFAVMLLVLRRRARRRS
jgi:hypothetical protein